MRLENFSSPNLNNTLAISFSGAEFIQWEALFSSKGFIRMSKGPSFMKLNPLSAVSNCGEETPRSNKIPLTFPWIFFDAASSPS
jgi:hypothetical protein